MLNDLKEINKENLLTKINLFLIIFLPIAILIGSSVINLFLVLTSIFFIIKIIVEKNFFFKNQTLYLLT